MTYAETYSFIIAKNWWGTIVNKLLFDNNFIFIWNFLETLELSFNST